MKARTGSAVRIDYELRTKGGRPIESSTESGPATFVVGRGAVLPALERRILGLRPGEEAHGEIPYSEATSDLPRMEIPVREFPDGALAEAGGTYEAKTLDGRPVRFRVIEVGELNVIVQLLPPAMDPLADIEFHVRLLAVDAPPPPPARAVGIDSAAIRIVDVEDEPN
jgi:FKBP-type peptidyl-prolyl cis-trans isomerase SlyD